MSGSEMSYGLPIVVLPFSYGSPFVLLYCYYDASMMLLCQGLFRGLLEKKIWSVGKLFVILHSNSRAIRTELLIKFL